MPGRAMGKLGYETDRPDTVVVGLGNPILGDDGVGWRVIAEVERRLLAAGPCAAPSDGSGAGVATACLSLGGLSLMEHLIGYRRAIIVDAVRGPGSPGTIDVLPLEAFAEARSGHVASAHDATLSAALELGRGLGAVLPETVWVVGVKVERLDEFSEALSPAVAGAVPAAAQRVLELLRDRQGLAPATQLADPCRGL